MRRSYAILISCMLILVSCLIPIRKANASSVTIFSEGFEGAFPGPNWTVYDANPANGYDYWDDTLMKSHGGLWSGWCAGTGTQYVNTTVWTQDFEGAWPTSDYQILDNNPDSGDDSWGATNYRSHSGYWSAWCAQNGTQSEALPTIVYNSDVHRYDNNMWTTMLKWADLSSYSFATFSFWYWIDSEPNSPDQLWFLYHMSNQTENPYVFIASGNSSGWQYAQVTIPANAVWTAIGFQSNPTNCNYEGAYVDDIALTGSTEASNTSVAQYDDNMMSYMIRSVDLSAYANANLSYWYWLSTETSYDSLQVTYHNSTGWFFTDTHTGWSYGWQYSETTIPCSADTVGLYFHSDSTAHAYEGAYVDDVVLTGEPLPTPYSAAIWSWENASGWLNESIQMDGVPTGYSTPHNFTGLTGTHTFTVPSTDIHGYPFKNWTTGETSTTITVSANGTYTAQYYTLPSVTIWAWDNASGWLNEPITMDGNPTGFSTPYSFTGLSGTHTFTVPSNDAYGNPFKNWTTGEMNPTITVSANGTYTAQYYVTPTIPEFPVPLFLTVFMLATLSAALCVKRARHPRLFVSRTRPSPT